MSGSVVGRSALAVVAVAMAMVAGTYAGTLTVQVEPRTEECFSFQAKQGLSYSLVWHVLRGGLLDIDVKVASPSGSDLYHKMHFEESDKGLFTFTAAAPGSHRVCLDNGMSRFTPKVVQLVTMGGASEEDVKKAAGAKPPADAVGKGDLKQLEKIAERVEDTLTEMGFMQRTYRRREIANRNTAESTNIRVMWLSLLVIAVTVVMTLAHAWLIKRLFRGR